MIASDECRRWDERYASEAAFFGEAPNPYLVSSIEQCCPGSEEPRPRALCLGEGEGRDALFLARRGFQVTAVDGSRVGLAKLATRAEREGLSVEIICAELGDYDPEPGAYDLTTAFYCHLPPALRRATHAQGALALRRGGLFVLEGFSPRQRELGLTSGGPHDATLLFEPAVLAEDFAGGPVEVLELRELALNLELGRHRGEARIVRLLGRAGIGAG